MDDLSVHLWIDRLWYRVPVMITETALKLV